MNSLICVQLEQLGLCLKTDNWGFSGSFIPGHLLVKETAQSHLICFTFHQNCSFIDLGHYQLFWVNGIPHLFWLTYHPKRWIPLLFYLIFNGIYLFSSLAGCFEIYKNTEAWSRPASLRDSPLFTNPLQIPVNCNPFFHGYFQALMN